MKLLTFGSNYADEFDLEGFIVVEDKDWVEYRKQLSKITKPFELYFGTNECFDFNDGGDLISSIEVKHIYAKEVAAIKRLFGESMSFGWTGFFEYEPEEWDEE